MCVEKKDRFDLQSISTGMIVAHLEITSKYQKHCIAIGAEFIFIANTHELHFFFGHSSDTLCDIVIMTANLIAICILFYWIERI